MEWGKEATTTMIPPLSLVLRAGCALVGLALGGVQVGGAEPDAPAFKQLRVGTVVVSLPAAWTRRGPDLPVWLHLHGAPAVVEAQFASIGAPGILVNVTLPGLSKVYADRFAAPGALAELLAAVEAALRAEAPEPGWRLGELTVTSFSAGFGGVRQMLREPAAFDRITALVMADSIYCGYTGDPKDKQVDPALMEGFLRFARLAADGRKRMVISHSAQVPEGYASTTETADFLIRALGGRRVEEPAAWDGGLQLLSHYRMGGLEILGFAGVGPEDHMRHLRGLGLLLARVTPKP